MNKKQLITALIMIASAVGLFGLHKVSVMYKQPNGQFYDTWKVAFWGCGPSDDALLSLLYFNKFSVGIMVLILGSFLICIFRNRKV